VPRFTLHDGAPRTDAKLLVRGGEGFANAYRGLKYVSKLREERMRAISARLADTTYDVVALQEIWVESEDWRHMRNVCADTYPHGKFFLTCVPCLG